MKTKKYKPVQNYIFVELVEDEEKESIVLTTNNKKIKDYQECKIFDLSQNVAKDTNYKPGDYILVHGFSIETYKDVNFVSSHNVIAHYEV